MFLFPYQHIKAGSNIILYGAGNVGRDFWLQMHLSRYCKICAWVDKGFDVYDVAPPFDHVKNIENYEFDYIVICVADKNVAADIKDYLIENKVNDDKIVWSYNYAVNTRTLFPDNKTLYLKNWEFYSSLMDEIFAEEDEFSCYQDLKSLGIPGARNSCDRIMLYKLDHYLKSDMSVIDIGCNNGYLDILIAPKVRSVLGIDVNSHHINEAKMVAEFMGINNVDFLCGDAFKDINLPMADVIFSLGVHGCIIGENISREDYISILLSHLNDDGFIFFESHAMRSLEVIRSFNDMIKLFQDRMDMCMLDSYYSAGERKIAVFRKR